MVRYGIAGFGLHAVKRLMPGFAMATGCVVSALSRRDLAKAQATAREWKVPHAFASVEELCQSPDVDAVFVTTPNSSHLADVLAAVKSGKPVLCEKPLGMNSDECRQMVEAARKAGVLFGVAQCFRFEDSTNRLRDRVAAGDIGRVTFARSEFSFPAGADHPRAWIYDESVAGGGPIADVGVHCIDTLRFILQDEVVAVIARATRDKLSGQMEAAALLTLEFSRGTLAMAPVSYRAEYRSPLELIGETGVLRADDCLNVEKPIHIHLRRGGSVAEAQTVSNRFAYARQVEVFAAAVEGKAEFPVPGEEGWQNQEVLDAAYRSIRSGKTEAVPQVKAPAAAAR
jgi:predicted dehydrogenase